MRSRRCKKPPADGLIQTKLDGFLTVSKQPHKKEIKENIGEMTISKRKAVKKPRNKRQTKDDSATNSKLLNEIKSSPSGASRDFTGLSLSPSQGTLNTPSKVISITKSKYLSAKKEKLKPRVLQREHLPLLSYLPPTHTTFHPNNHSLSIDITSTTLTSTQDSDESNSTLIHRNSSKSSSLSYPPHSNLSCNEDSINNNTNISHLNSPKDSSFSHPHHTNLSPNKDSINGPTNIIHCSSKDLSFSPAHHTNSSCNKVPVEDNLNITPCDSSKDLRSSPARQTNLICNEVSSTDTSNVIHRDSSKDLNYSCEGHTSLSCKDSDGDSLINRNSSKDFNSSCIRQRSFKEDSVIDNSSLIRQNSSADLNHSCSRQTSLSFKEDSGIDILSLIDRNPSEVVHNSLENETSLNCNGDNSSLNDQISGCRTSLNYNSVYKILLETISQRLQQRRNMETPGEIIVIDDSDEEDHNRPSSSKYSSDKPKRKKKSPQRNLSKLLYDTYKNILNDPVNEINASDSCNSHLEQAQTLISVAKLAEIENIVANFDEGNFSDIEMGNIFKDLENLEKTSEFAKAEGAEKLKEGGKSGLKRGLDKPVLSLSKKIASNPPSPKGLHDTAIIKSHPAKSLEKPIEFNHQEPVQLEDYGVDVTTLAEIPVQLEFLQILDKQDTTNHFTCKFYQILRFIFRHANFEMLLNQEEKVILYDFLLLPGTYHYVCLKLFTHLAKWYNIFKFMASIHAELDTNDAIAEMVEILVKKKFLDSDYMIETPSYLLDLLNLEDVRDIHKQFKLKPKKNARKADLIEAIITNCNRQTTLTADRSSECVLKDRVVEKLGFCVKLNLDFCQLLYRVHSLYSFTNVRMHHPRDLYFFMDQIVSKDIVLPRYKIDSNFQIFETDDEFKRFAMAKEYYDEFLLAKEKKNDDVLECITKQVFDIFKELVHERRVAIKESSNRRFCVGNMYAKILSKACLHFVQQPEFISPILELLLSQCKYGRSDRADWYNRLALIAETHLKDIERSAEIIIEALCSPLTTTQELHEISERGKRMITKKSNRPRLETAGLLKILLKDFNTTVNVPVTEIDGNSLPMKRPGARTLFLENETIMHVEDVALKYYEERGFPSGIHCEGRLMTIFYFYFFWDIIYKSRSGVFISEIQYIPLDFYSKDFYTNRKSEIDSRLKQIETDWSREELKTEFMFTYQMESDKFCLDSCGSWKDLVGAGELMEILDCLDRGILRDILYKFALDFKHFHSGMPDLFLWCYKTKKCKFVEVKGGKDQLSVKQKLWLRYLKEIEADVEVCHVRIKDL